MLQSVQQDGAVLPELARHLAGVEERFAAELLSDLSCVNALAEHVERYRGKMLRPTLVLVSAMAGFEEEMRDAAFAESVEVMATVAELVHMATLVHDDILDEARMRRGGASINHLRGNEAAVMLGDYLISHAYHLCSAIGRPAVSRAVAQATNAVCDGELLQLHHRQDWSLNEGVYFAIIDRKTASLCGTCCRLPGVLHSGRVDGGASPRVNALQTYGRKVGTAFQIIDDVLDLCGTQREVGKTLGRDLEKGKLTLALIRTLDQARDGSKHGLLADLRQVGSDPAAAGRLRAAVGAGDGLAYARGRARTLVDEAKTAVDTHLPPGPAVDLLVQMADAIVARRK